MAGYQVAEEYANQEGEGRVVKFLLYTALVDMEDPARPDVMVRVERLYKQGETVPADVLSDYNLERGERLGAFFTDAEMDAGAHEAPGVLESAPPATEPPAFSEMSESELAEYIMSNKPNVGDTIAMAGGDADAARRLLEAEHIATDGEPRAGVVKGLNAVIEEE